MTLSLKDEVVLPLDTEPKILCTDEPGHHYFVEYCLKRRDHVVVYSEAGKWYWSNNGACKGSFGPFDKEHLALQDIKKTFHESLMVIREF